MIGTIRELKNIDADIAVENYGSIVLVRPLTLFAEQWIGENVTDPQWFASAVAVEPRYLETLINGMIADGLIIRE